MEARKGKQEKRKGGVVREEGEGGEGCELEEEGEGGRGGRGGAGEGGVEGKKAGGRREVKGEGE